MVFVVEAVDVFYSDEHSMGEKYMLGQHARKKHFVETRSIVLDLDVSVVQVSAKSLGLRDVSGGVHAMFLEVQDTNIDVNYHG